MPKGAHMSCRNGMLIFLLGMLSLGAVGEDARLTGGAKRRALHEFKQEGVFHGIEDAYDLEERIPGLWAYAVGHAGGGEDAATRHSR